MKTGLCCIYTRRYQRESIRMIRKNTSKKHAEFSNLHGNSYVVQLCGKSHYGCLGVKNYVDMLNIFVTMVALV